MTTPPPPALPPARPRRSATQLYRLSLREQDGSHCGYVFFSSKREAEKRAAHEDHLKSEIEAIQVRRTRAGVLIALNLYGGHPDNG